MTIQANTIQANTVAVEASTPIPLAEIWPWLLFVPVLLLAIYMVGVEEGATALFKGMYVHEFVHDARHLLGFPCH